MPTRLRRIALLLSLALASQRADAVTLDWSNPLGGLAGTAGNWTPARVPAAADVLVFAINPVNAYTVTFGAGVDTVASHAFTAGRVNLVASAPHFGTAVFAVAPNPGNTATATLAGGALRAGADVRIGAAAGASGTLVVSGAGTLFRQAAGGSFQVGSAGTGLVQVTGGAQLTPTSDVVIGLQSGSGTLSVAGFTGGPATRSRLSVGTDAQGRSTIVGRTNGRGTLIVADGAELVQKGALVLAPAAGDTGALVVGGVLASDSARVTITGDLELASGTGGVASAVLDSFGVVVVSGTTTLGSVACDTASLTLHAKSRFETHDLVWDRTHAALAWDGGVLQVRGGALQPSDSMFVVDAPLAGGACELLEGASAALRSPFPPITSQPAIEVRGYGDTFLRLEGGSHVAVANGFIEVFERVTYPTPTAHAAELVLEGASTLDAPASSALIGQNAAGALRVRSGSTVTLGALSLSGTVAEAEAEVSGAGSRASVGGTGLRVPAYSFGVYGRRASVTVSDGALFELTDPSASATLDSGGVLRLLPGGTADVRRTCTLLPGSTLAMSGGTLRCDTLSAIQSDTLYAGGTIDACLRGTAFLGVAPTLVATSPLTVGRAIAGVKGVDFPGAFVVRGTTLALRDSLRTPLHGVVMIGGTLALGAGGATLASGAGLTGEGTVAGDLALDAGAHVTGTATGHELHFTGPLHGSLSALLHHAALDAGCVFTGSGTLLDTLVMAPGSKLVADGDVSIGVASRRIDGDLDLGAHRLSGIGRATLGGRTTMEGGRIDPVTTVSAGAVFSGHGGVYDSLTVDGELVLGAPHGRLHGEGMLRVYGTFTLELGAKSDARDTLAVDGTLYLLGVVNVKPMPGFNWHPGDSLVVGQYWGVDSHLASLRFDGVAVPGQIELHAHANQLWLVFMPAFAAVGDAPLATPLRFAALDSPGPRASLALEMPAPASVTVRLFDLAGREVARLHDGPLGPGHHRFALGALALAPGVHFARADVRRDGADQVRIARVVTLR